MWFLFRKRVHYELILYTQECWIELIYHKAIYTQAQNWKDIPFLCCIRISTQNYGFHLKYSSQGSSLSCFGSQNKSCLRWVGRLPPMPSCVKGHWQSHLRGEMEKENSGKWRDRQMWKLYFGTIISAPVPRAEAFCRSCLNSVEERTANGDGCWCSFSLSTRKQEKFKNKYILKN